MLIHCKDIIYNEIILTIIYYLYYYQIAFLRFAFEWVTDGKNETTGFINPDNGWKLEYMSNVELFDVQLNFFLLSKSKTNIPIYFQITITKQKKKIK